MVAESQGHPGNSVDENSLKRRMLGAAVLIALAVIFLPLVFDGSGTESQFRSIEPLQMEAPYDATIFEEKTMSLVDGTPVIDFIEDNQLTLSEINEVSLQAERAKQNANTRPVAAVAEPITTQASQNKLKQVNAVVKPVIEPNVVQPLPTANPQPVVDNSNWLIQIASFRDKINALGLRSDLKKDGHPVVVKVGDIAGDAIFRVFVGPIQGRDKASQAQTTLESNLNRETLLIDAD